MKHTCLTLTPPWGSLIAVAARRPALGKHIETRSWSTAYRGPLLIHQAKGLAGMSEADLAALCRSESFKSALAAIGITEAAQLPRGAFVAVVQLRGCISTELISRAHGWYTNGKHWPCGPTDPERAFGNYAIGRYAWPLDDIRALSPPIAARGMQGLWTWEGELP